MQNDLDRMREENYLFDPGASPEESIVTLERALEPFRYPVHSHPLRLPLRSRRNRSKRILSAMVAAAAAVFLLAIGLRAWIWSWPDGRPWQVLSSAADGIHQLAEGERLEVGSGEAVVLRVARIGRMRVESGSEMRLLSTGGTRHLLALERGSLSIGVWAPPFSVLISTPAGTVSDLGCAFELRTTDDLSEVNVTSGWVHLENEVGEVLVPEGAWGWMRRGVAPGVPIFADASLELRQAVRRLEGAGSSDADLAALRAEARPRDAYTILLLSMRAPDQRAELISLAAGLSPPLSEETLERAEMGDRRAVWEWIRTLDLPPPKGWVRNWRDAFGG